jgi:hypothetical protein
MVLVVDVERDLVHIQEPDFTELSQKLRTLGRDMRNLTLSEPDFAQKLECLRKQLDSVACRLRRG